MSARRILTDVWANITIWRRSPTGVFFTVAFPLLLVFVFGSILGGDDAGDVTLAVQDNDRSFDSRALLEGLNGTGAVQLRIIAPGDNATETALDDDLHSTLVVPAGWGRQLRSGGPAELVFLYDPSRAETRTAITAVQSVVQSLNLRTAGVTERAIVRPQSIRGDADDAGGYIEFFLPGVIGMTITTNALIGGLELSATLKQTGIMRKIATTPVRRWEWVTAKAIYQVFLGAITTAVVLAAGLVFYDVQVRLDWRWPLLVVFAGAAFAGLAMALSRWVTKPDQANAAGSAVAFPMMFLSGTFFPLESMPSLLQGIARLLPLTYVNEALRAAMLTYNDRLFLMNGAATVVFCAASLVAGSLLVRWKEV